MFPFLPSYVPHYSLSTSGPHRQLLDFPGDSFLLSLSFPWLDLRKRYSSRTNSDQSSMTLGSRGSGVVGESLAPCNPQLSSHVLRIPDLLLFSRSLSRTVAYVRFFLICLSRFFVPIIWSLPCVTVFWRIRCFIFLIFSNKCSCFLFFVEFAGVL